MVSTCLLTCQTVHWNHLATLRALPMGVNTRQNLKNKLLLPNYR